MQTVIKHLNSLYKSWSGKEPLKLDKIPGSGSNRRYFRITGKHGSVIGAVNDDERENDAFFALTQHFRDEDLPVPELLATDRKRGCYLLTDLGDVTLFSRLTELRKQNEQFPDEITGLYQKVLEWLPRFQVEAGKGIDYKKCYPRPVFDLQSMRWDLNYFKYYFLKLVKASFDEQKLEDDYETLTTFLLSAGTDHFMYRDFQSRNIMIVDGQPWFIDYQGGRKGALHYDIASLLYDSKAGIPEPVREQLLGYYLGELNRYIKVEPETFTNYYYGFVLIRILQALGAYGFRGYYENKPHFLQSIPYALKNLQFLIETGKIPVRLPMLMKVLQGIITEFKLPSRSQAASNLTVLINSFSYKNGIPADDFGNGGGFVFDCRALPNPGRYPEYASLSGKDRPVIEFLKKERAVDEFINHSFSLVEQSIRTYMDRGFIHLQVNFGCTGGQHRSVYCAEMLANYLREHFPVNVIVKHTAI